MTNECLITVVKSNTVLKAIYKNKRFFRVELIKGFDAYTISHLGAILPCYLSDIELLQNEYLGKVNYTEVVKEKSIYTKFTDAWFLFYEQYGFAPKFDGTDGRALKSIIKYLIKTTGTELEAIALWKIILNKWNDLPEFHRNQKDLKYINSKLNIILNALKQKNEASTTKSGTKVGL